MPSEPLILGFDTSAAHCAAALLSGDHILTSHSEDMGRGQAERLFPMLEEILAGAGAGWADLSALAVGTGPGNFTGIRISVSAARGLALALNIPAIGIDGFTAAAFEQPGPVRCILPAPRAQVYLRDPGQAPQLVAQDALPETDLPVAHLPGPKTLAESIARCAAAGLGVTPPAPLYVRPADAAPSATRPPVLLADDP